jgi:hypothetical protein
VSPRRKRNELISHRAERPVPYWIQTRYLDRHAGKVDGRGNVLAAHLPAAPNGTRPIPALRNAGDAPGSGTISLTPYLGAISNRYGEQAEMVHVRADADVEPSLRALIAIDHRIVVAHDALAAVRAELSGVPERAPEDVLLVRSVLEQAHGICEELVRARNQRSWDARRGEIVHRERDAAGVLHALRQQRADLIAAITVRRRIAATRVRRLLEHALRRHRTYERQLVRRHRDGPALLPLIAVARPVLPEWVERYSVDQDPVTP